MIYGQPYGQFPQGAPHPGDPNAQQQWQQQQARAAQLQQAQLQAYHMQSHQVNQHHQQQLRMFWQQQMQEIESGSDFKNHQLPLARIKKIMKSDEDVRMISSEAPVLFAKACEMFILELTLRSWIHSEENKRRTLQRNDIAAAITKTDIFDFLVDIVPRDDFKEDGMNVPRAPPRLWRWVRREVTARAREAARGRCRPCRTTRGCITCSRRRGRWRAGNGRRRCRRIPTSTRCPPSNDRGKLCRARR